MQIPREARQPPHEGRKTLGEAGKIAHEGHSKAPEALKVTHAAVQVPPERLQLPREGLTTAPEGTRPVPRSGNLTLAVGFNPRKIVEHVLVGVPTDESGSPVTIQLSLTRQSLFYSAYRGLKPTAKFTDRYAIKDIRHSAFALCNRLVA